MGFLPAPKGNQAKSKGFQAKGGKLLGGLPAKSKSPKRNAGVALSQEVIDAIAKVPEIESNEWSRSYLVEQLLRNYLGLPADLSLTITTEVVSPSDRRAQISSSVNFEPCSRRLWLLESQSRF
jgi:hypothetical protein